MSSCCKKTSSTKKGGRACGSRGLIQHGIAANLRFLEKVYLLFLAPTNSNSSSTSASANARRDPESPAPGFEFKNTSPTTSPVVIPMTSLLERIYRRHLDDRSDPDSSSISRTATEVGKMRKELLEALVFFTSVEHVACHAVVKTATRAAASHTAGGGKSFWIREVSAKNTAHRAGAGSCNTDDGDVDMHMLELHAARERYCAGLRMQLRYNLREAAKTAGINNYGG
mmetsp:Transcript_16171/g.39953  ORF Transcript_16171/g.39953 Transcript_16171/m.39953 type:complete len:227 (+) Transcript_16171:737-1417(+)|eukprot:g18418.t1